MKVALIGCTKTKRAMPCPAQCLYTGQLFAGAVRFAQRLGVQAWYVLSAKYGLVAPATIIAPYELTLNTMGAGERAAWGARVAEQIRSAVPAGATLVLLAGERYREPIYGALRNEYAIESPTAGLSLGRTLSLYKQGGCRA